MPVQPSLAASTTSAPPTAVLNRILLTTAGIASAFLAIRKSFRQLWVRLGAFALANLFAIALSLPVLVLLAIAAYLAQALHLAPFAIVILLGILPNPFMAGLQFMARELAQDDLLSLRDQWQGFRQCARSAAILWVPSIALTALIIFEVTFYFSASGAGGGSFHLLNLILGFLWAFVLLFWLSIHLYVFPLLIEDDEKRIWSTYRDSVVIAVSRPLYTSIVSLTWLAILFVSSVTGLAAVMGLALGALIQQNTFAVLIPTFERDAT
jgi:hypothetical protein